MTAKVWYGRKEGRGRVRTTQGLNLNVLRNIEDDFEKGTTFGGKDEKL